MFDEHDGTDAIKTLPPLTPVAQTYTTLTGHEREPRRRWIVWVVLAVLLVAGATTAGTWWYLNQQTNERVEQAAADVATLRTVSSAYTQAQSDHNAAIADAADFAPRLERVIAKINEYPALFEEIALQRFTSIVTEYAPAATAEPHDEALQLSAARQDAALESTYRQGGADYERVRAELAAEVASVGERAEQLAARAEGIRTTRGDVDAALAALAASATTRAPDAAVQFPKASDAAKQAVATALAEVAKAAEGTFAAMPERMPTAVLYEYVAAVIAADASHAKAVEEERLAAEAESARLAAAAEAEARSNQQRISSASAPPTYSGGGSKQEWMSAAGISESDWGYVDYIVAKESGWNPNAINASSGACGLVQIMPLHTAAYETCTDPVANLSWANNYANGRYGGWAGAYDFWVNNHWW